MTYGVIVRISSLPESFSALSGRDGDVCPVWEVTDSSCGVGFNCTMAELLLLESFRGVLTL